MSAAVATTHSHDLFAKALRYLPGGVNSPVRAFRAVGGEPFFAQKANGAHVQDVDGNRYIDYVCTWGPSILGHAAPEIIEAVSEAAWRGTSFGIPHAGEVSLAEKIIDWVPSVQKVRLCNSGTEATMSAIRLARGYTGRDRIIKFEGCYHGHVDSLLVKAGSGAMTNGAPDSAGVPAALAELTTTLPFNDLDAVRDALTAHPGEYAAIILEPIPANAGLIPPEEGYLEGLRSLCSEHDSLLIFDEVMTGFRLGKAGAQGLLGVTPDLCCFGKVIGGGLPVGALGGRADIMDRLAPDGDVYQAGTLSGNPLAVAAGHAALSALETKDGFAKLESLGQTLEEGARQAFADAGIPHTLHRYGSMFCAFFAEGPIRNMTDALRSDRERFAAFFHGMLRRGIYLAPSQFETGFLSLAHTTDDIHATVSAMKETLSELS